MRASLRTGRAWAEPLYIALRRPSPRPPLLNSRRGRFAFAWAPGALWRSRLVATKPPAHRDWGRGGGRGPSAASPSWRVPSPHPRLLPAHRPVCSDARISSTPVFQPKFCLLPFFSAWPVSAGPLLHLSFSGPGAALTLHPPLGAATPCALPFRDPPEAVPLRGPCGPTGDERWVRTASARRARSW